MKPAAPASRSSLVQSFPLLSLLPFILIARLLIGCATSKPPPPPEPRAIALANRTAAQAAKLSENQNWSAAAREWELAADRFALVNDRGSEAIAFHNAGQAQRELGQLDKAHQFLTRAADLNEKLGRTEEWWRNQIALLQIETQAERTGALKTRIEKLATQANQLQDRSIQGLFLNELGLWQQSQGDLEAAAATFRQAWQHFQTANDDVGVATVQANQARLHEAEKNYSAAIELWRAALVKFESLGDPRAIARALAGQGRAVLAAGTDLAASEELLRLAARNYRILDSPQDLQGTLELLLKSLEAQGTKDEAKAVRAELQRLMEQPSR